MKKLSDYLVENWFKIKKEFPVISTPLFHATNSIIMIKRSGKIIDASSGGESKWGSQQKGISTSRNLDFLLDGRFGNSILVFDKKEIQRRYKIEPFQFGSASDEFEERIVATSIPDSYIKVVIMTSKNPNKLYIKEWSMWPYPVVVNIDGVWQKV